MKKFLIKEVRVNDPHFKKRLFSRYPLAEEREIEDFIKSSAPIKGFYYNEDLQHTEVAVLIPVHHPDYGVVWVICRIFGGVLQLRTVLPPKEGEEIPPFYSACDEWRKDRGEIPPLKKDPPMPCEVQFIGG